MGLWRHPLLILLFITCASCCGISMNYGNVTPVDPALNVNDTLRVHCSLFNSSITYQNNTYSVSSENLLFKFQSAYLQDVNILDDLSIEYVVQSAHEEDSGLYSCYVAIPQLDTKVFVCATSIEVGYTPLPVTNFSCISYEYTNLTCSWVKPFNPVSTTYELYDYLRFERFRRRCPEVLNETSCRWTLDTKPQYLLSHSKLYFLIIGTNKLGEYKQYASEDHFKIVKPGIPTSIKIMDVTETTLVVRWSPPKYMNIQFRPGLEYSVYYQPLTPFPGDIQEVRKNVSQGDGQVLIENLVPHTEYHFSIRCRSAEVDNDDFWSPSATAVERTVSDVPYMAPEMTPSTFDVENILGNRTVTVYWKAVPPQFENGDGFHYVVRFHIHHVFSHSRVKRETFELDVGNKTLYSFPHLDSHSAYIFRIFAANSDGPSMNSSHIIIDKADKLLEKPKDITVISYGQGEFNLSWRASNQKPYNFTVYWCKTVKPRPSKCDGPLEWLHTTKTKHMLQLPDKDTSYQFAVSANDDGYTSGMSWASCIVYFKGVKYKVRNVGLQPKNATSLKIQWSVECEAQKIVMKEYAIQYCEFAGPCSENYQTRSCSDPKTVNVSDVSKEDFILGSLKPYTYYMAFMRVHTLSGWSANSNVACEMTMSTAPSDSPQNVSVISVDGKDISLSFEPPKIPNGVVSRYIVYYNKTEDGTSHQKVFRAKDMHHKGTVFTINLTDYMTYYTNYSIELEACVDQACSGKSPPQYAFTSISKPSIISPPRIEVMDDYVNITWDDPVLANGPLNYFQILMDGGNASRFEIFNVTDQNYFILHPNCSENKDVVHDFRVRAVNIKDGTHLVGNFSSPTKNKLCSAGISVYLYVGITIGLTTMIGFVIGVGFLLVKWMKKQVESYNNLKIQLPRDLESPMENPLSSYDKFKNGLQTNHDSGIPCDTSYERLCEFAQDKDLNRIPGENSQKLKRKSSGRNNSGESSASVKCHDSISSSNTTKTHLSIDSGAEVDSPPSPDALFSDTSSSHTTPRSYKPDLTIVQEGFISKDSGLEREGTCTSANQNIPLPSKFSYFVKKKNFPNSNRDMLSYSKFAVSNNNNASPFVPYGEQSLGLLDQHSLSNSEPSVAEFDPGNGSEPLMPYSKFGLARSAGNGLNVAGQPLSVHPKIGYSKFGTVYRALKRQDSNDIPTVNGSVVTTCPKPLPHNPQTFTALTVSGHPQDKQLPVKDNDKAYSKFGVSKQNTPISGYVCFKDTLSYPSADSGTAYSKVGVTSSQIPLPENDQVKEKEVIINPAELQALPPSSQTPLPSCGSPKEMNNSTLNKEGDSSRSKPEQPANPKTQMDSPKSETEQLANSRTQTDKDNVEEEDKDCFIPDSAPSLLDEITLDLGSKLKPTNFTISASNDTKGFLLQEESEPVSQLTNIMDALFGEFHLPGDSLPITITLEDLNAPDDYCELCSQLLTECSCNTDSRNTEQTEVICNGHISPLPDLSDYVQTGCKPAC